MRGRAATVYTSHELMNRTSSGTGAKSAKDIVTCTACEGRGIRLVRHQLGPGIFQQMQMHCDRYVTRR